MRPVGPPLQNGLAEQPLYRSLKGTYGAGFMGRGGVNWIAHAKTAFIGGPRKAAATTTTAPRRKIEIMQLAYHRRYRSDGSEWAHRRGFD